jgi:hypothetical protein
MATFDEDAPRQPPFVVTGNFKQDVNNPLFQDAENRVLSWLRKQEASASWPWGVIDRRDKHREGDFVLLPLKGGPERLLDVKCDVWSIKTGRFAWEEKLVQADGREYPGWGKSNLDYVVYVTPQPKDAEGRWEAWIVDAKALRTGMEYYIAHKPLQSLTERGWKQFDKRNTDGRRGVGWAVPRNQLRPITKRIILI